MRPRIVIIIITGPIIIIIHIFSSKLDSDVKLINHSNLAPLPQYCWSPVSSASQCWSLPRSYNCFPSQLDPGNCLSGHSHTFNCCTLLLLPKYLLYLEKERRHCALLIALITTQSIDRVHSTVIMTTDWAISDYSH